MFKKPAKYKWYNITSTQRSFSCTTLENVFVMIIFSKVPAEKKLLKISTVISNQLRWIIMLDEPGINL